VKLAIRRFIEEIIAPSANDRERRGCFLINSALEVAPHDRELGAEGVGRPALALLG
jgi:TetR/AcrR family transcriptional repressor of nem operon